MSDLRAMLGDRYRALATAISATASDWIGHDTPSSPHGWRCEDKARYPGPCGCDGEMADEVMGVLGDILPDLLAQAWDEGRQLGLKQADYEFGVALSMPDLTNPYRQEAVLPDLLDQLARIDAILARSDHVCEPSSCGWKRDIRDIREVRGA